MSLTSRARVTAACAAICATTLAGGTAASAAPSSAGPSRDCACGGARVTEHSAPTTTPPAERPVAQAAPTWPMHPATLTRPHAAAPSGDGGFHWDDAGIGAGGAIAIVLAAGGGALLFRRRQVPGAHPAT